VNNLRKLQLWYSKQCDGSWEHHYGVSIDTLDNPGWTVVVDLTGTDLQSMQMESITEEKNEQTGSTAKSKMRSLLEMVGR
jgi:hypothetical protein